MSAVSSYRLWIAFVLAGFASVLAAPHPQSWFHRSYSPRPSPTEDATSGVLKYPKDPHCDKNTKITVDDSVGCYIWNGIAPFFSPRYTEDELTVANNLVGNGGNFAVFADEARREDKPPQRQLRPIATSLLTWRCGADVQLRQENGKYCLYDDKQMVQSCLPTKSYSLPLMNNPFYQYISRQRESKQESKQDSKGQIENGEKLGASAQPNVDTDGLDELLSEGPIEQDLDPA